MKAIFTVLISILVMQISSWAGPKGGLIPVLPKHTPTLGPVGLTLSIPLYDAFAAPDALAKTAGAQSRMVSQYSGAGTVASSYRNGDSIFYTYSGLRGGDLNSTMNYDAARSFKWDSIGNKWKPYLLVNRSYDAMNRVTSELVQTWNSSTNIFVNNSRYAYSYNASGKPTVLKSEAWNVGTNAWVNYSQYTNFTYNSGGNPTGYIYQIWKPTSSSWVNSQRFTGTYTTHGEVSGWLTELWNSASSSWANMTNETYSYNSAYKNTRYNLQTWDGGSNTWRNSLGYTFLYNGSSHNIGFVRQIGSSSGPSWVNTDSFSYTVNSMGSPTTAIGYVWSVGWQQAERQLYTYTTANLESSYTRETWNGTDYTGVERDYSTYNSFGQLIRNYEETFNGNAWVIGQGDGLARYAYQPYGTNVGSTPENDVQVVLYPNPTQQYLNLVIDWKNTQLFSVTIYDVSGKLLQNWQVAPTLRYSKQLDIRTWPGGLYLVQVQSGTAAWNKTFSVQH